MHQPVHRAPPTGRLLIAAIVVALSAGVGPVAADDPAAPQTAATFTIRGSGAITCVQWSQDHHGSSEILREVDNSWVLGYITGFNKWGAAGRGDILNGAADPNSALAWIGDYCNHYPTDKLETAVSALIMDIQKTSAPPQPAQPSPTAPSAAQP